MAVDVVMQCRGGTLALLTEHPELFLHLLKTFQVREKSLTQNFLWALPIMVLPIHTQIFEFSLFLRVTFHPRKYYK